MGCRTKWGWTDISCLPEQLPSPMEGLSSQLDQSIFFLGTRWYCWMLSLLLGTNPASPPHYT